MQLLLSLPENLTDHFNTLEQDKRPPAFVVSDPPDAKAGSGGGTAWLLAQHFETQTGQSFEDYLKAEKKVIIHAGGQGRRLPAYAPSGKILTPVPVFRWSRGQRLDQNLLDLQVPLYERLVKMTSNSTNTLIASGDVFIKVEDLPPTLPQADVVCLGIWTDPHFASRHGVFFSKRTQPGVLDFMLQKPTHNQIEELTASHFFMMDVGVWLLSDRAVKTLMHRCGWKSNRFENRTPSFYDLYSTFGASLGDTPRSNDTEINELSAAIVSLENGDFFHYGTTMELISSTEKVQNTIQDQRNIWHNRVKPHPSLFVQNASTHIKWQSNHHHIWIENSHVPQTWRLLNHHVITGIPRNNWQLTLPERICIDIVPIDQTFFAIRPYGIDDRFNGNPLDASTKWLEQPVTEWLKIRGISSDESGFSNCTDIQETPLFPLLEVDNLSEQWIDWMVNGTGNHKYKNLWLKAPRISAQDINRRANLERLYAQRQSFRLENIPTLAANYHRSVFYHTDLKQTAIQYASGNLQLPSELPESETSMLRFRDAMFRSEVLKNKGIDGSKASAQAFEILRETILDSGSSAEMPRLNVFPDQIVWGRSPARLDLAGGWSDTPPYCLQNGGRVVNLGVNLNGQPPLQVFIRLSDQPHIVLRSIDNGVTEVIKNFDALAGRGAVGSAFAIPRVALCLAGFHPKYCLARFGSLKEQLSAFGGGIEISLLAAIPKGSGLGTSSILGATILGALADFCALPWDNQAICHRTLMLEQILTTGGGWQDQYGGILPGIKLLETTPGTQENMSVHWLPDLVFTRSGYKNNWLLYYTGITRVAKNILSEIVRGMFLNEGTRLRVVNEIKAHASATFDAIQKCDYELTARMIARSWDLNQALDPGTNTKEIQSIINKIDRFTYGYKLLGAGGGGYMLMAAQDAEAANKIKELLTLNPPNNKARFVEMTLNTQGLEISRS